MESTERIYLQPSDRIVLQGVGKGQTYQKIADQIGVTARTVQLRIEKMVNNGLVEKITGPGGRSKHGKAGRALTVLGEKHLEEINGKNQS